MLREVKIMQIQPLGDRVVVKPKPKEEKTKGGIYLPDTASKERPMEGSVMAIGPGRRTDEGKLIPMNVQVGQQVLFAKYAGTEFEIDDQEFLILQEKDILGVIKEE
jgi:chaperonin GroES